MNDSPLILCPVDFSDASAGAVRYAAAIAARFGARVLVLTVVHPLLADAVDLGTGVVWDPDACKGELAEFAVRAGAHDASPPATFEYEVAVGKPAVEILRVAQERSCSLTVISTQGLTGMRKLFFGSTTERVLRETLHPVLITPPVVPRPLSFEQAQHLVRRVLVPVDLSAGSLNQTQTAKAIAQTLNAPMLLAYVIEPVKSHVAGRRDVLTLEADQRAVAEDRLSELVATLPRRLHPEALVAYGDPAEELAKIANDRHAGLTVVGLHGSPLIGPRMGSVTYRFLCLSRNLVLALPPGHVSRLPWAASEQGIGLAK